MVTDRRHEVGGWHARAWAAARLHEQSVSEPWQHNSPVQKSISDPKMKTPKHELKRPKAATQDDSHVLAVGAVVVIDGGAAGAAHAMAAEVALLWRATLRQAQD